MFVGERIDPALELASRLLPSAKPIHMALENASREIAMRRKVITEKQTETG